jgi:hypothetical protein
MEDANVAIDSSDGCHNKIRAKVFTVFDGRGETAEGGGEWC